MQRSGRRSLTLLLFVLAAGVLVAATQAVAVEQTLKNGCTSSATYSGAITSPSFTTGSLGSTVSFQGWFEAEGVAPSSHDLTTVQYGVPDINSPGDTLWTTIGQLTPSSATGGGQPFEPFSNNGLSVTPTFDPYPNVDAPLDEAALPTGASDVKIRFVFDAADPLYNGFRGVGIDNVAVSDSSLTTQAFETAFGTGANNWIADTSAGAGTPFWQVTSGSGISVKNPEINPDLVTLPDSGGLPTNGTGYAWFGDAATGSFCGPGYADRAQQQPPPPPPPKKTLKDLPPPVLGKVANVEPLKGTVLVGIKSGAAAAGRGARASQKGITFVPLQEARQVPVGSFLDTRKGTVALQSSAGSAGKSYQGNFTSGLFQLLQSRKKSAKGLTDLVIKGKYSSCKAKKKGKRAQAALSKKALRRLTGNAKGRFRTRGRFSAATVRGTKWGVTDRCDNTLTRVFRGKVAVRDFRRKKTILVKAGKQYVAKAKR